MKLMLQNTSRGLIPLYDADKKLIIKPCILVERLDGNIEINGKKYELKHS